MSGPPARILIAYDSWDGHAARVAQEVAEGAASSGGAPALKAVRDCVRGDFKDLDGVVLGSPVHQRGMSWPMKKFIDELCEPSWFYDDMVGRVAGVFTTGGGHGEAGGGAVAAQMSMLANLAAMGCVLVPFPKTTRGFDVAGMHWGPHVRVTGADMGPRAPDDLDAEALAGARSHGAAVARLARFVRDGARQETVFDRGARWPSAEVRAARSAHDGAGGAQGEPR